MRVIGLDVCRTFAEVAYLDDGVLRAGGRVELSHAALNKYAQGLRPTDDVVLEATTNTASIAAALRPHVRRVVVANPLQVRLIAESRIKTDKIDAAILAQLYASGFLPEVWIPDERTQALRRQVARRAQIVRQRTRLKNEIHAVLAAHLIERCPATDLFGKKGRAWLAEQPLPLDERLGIEQRLRQLDNFGEDLQAIERQLGQAVLGDDQVKRLLTINGVNINVAISLIAAIGDIGRFRSPQKLVSYFGLNPRVRQSGVHPAYHGRISKIGRSHARAMLVEAAWATAKTPGPLRSFFLRIHGRRGMQIAAVATARKLATVVWYVLTGHQDYTWSRPALTAQKYRALELRAGSPARKGQRGPAAEYSLREVREKEREMLEHAERAYARFVEGWKRRGPKPIPKIAMETS